MFLFCTVSLYHIVSKATYLPSASLFGHVECNYLCEVRNAVAYLFMKLQWLMIAALCQALLDDHSQGSQYFVGYQVTKYDMVHHNLSLCASSL